MNYRITLVFVCLCLAQLLAAQNWDYIRTSGEYYYGVGTGKTEPEADKAALANLTSQIATHVSSDFTQIDDMTTRNGELEHESTVLNCIKTYSQSTLTNTERWVVGKEPNISVRRYLKRSELARIFESRIAKAKDMARLAAGCLQKGKVDMALQYYYWAYSLVRSLQFPDEVKDDTGSLLINWIPLRIEEILSDIDVEFCRKDGDCVDLLFTYQGKPVSSLEFSYSDGRTDCQGSARDGHGMMEMIPGYEGKVYHLNIDYECKGQARGDAEMESVLAVITPRKFSKASFVVENKEEQEDKAKDAEPSSLQKGLSDKTNGQAGAEDSIMAKAKEQMLVMDRIIAAIERRDGFEAGRHMTIEGLEVYGDLIGRGNARVVNKDSLFFSKRTDGRTMVRGLQMSFTFNKGRKHTIVDEVVFTLNTDNKVENIAFGLGKVAEDDILHKYAPGWNDETREMLIDFLENYKTAYNLKRIDYIRNIFADDAVIIVGNVAKRKNIQYLDVKNAMSLEGQNAITYNRYTKDQYLKNLERCMNNNEFINIRFANNDIQWLEKYEKEEIFAIQIGQEYNSTTYADMGYLFLLVDMTNHDEPLIKIRTWQPNEVDMDKIYHAGYFYNE